MKLGTNHLGAKLSSIVISFMVAAILVEEFATDIFLPVLPLMTDYFDASEAVAQMTIGVYLFGLAIIRPLYGILSDCYGRRPVLMWGMVAFFISSIVCYFAPTIETLIAARFFQGLGAGAAIVIGFAAVKDLFDEEKCARIISLMSFIIAMAPAAAPIVGGHMADIFGWRSTFLLIAVMAGIVTLVIMFFMPETLPADKHVPLNYENSVKRYLSVMIHKRFMYYVLIQSFSIFALWSWIAGIPIHYINDLDVSVSAYGYYALTGVIAYMLGTLINFKLLKYITIDQAITVGLCLMATSCFAMFGYYMLDVQNPIIVQSINIPFGIGVACILPNTTTGALDSIDHGRGIGASIIGTLQMLMGSVGAQLVGTFADGTLMPIALTMSTGIFSSIIMFQILKNYKAKLEELTCKI